MKHSRVILSVALIAILVTAIATLITAAAADSSNKKPNNNNNKEPQQQKKKKPATPAKSAAVEEAELEIDPQDGNDDSAARAPPAKKKQQQQEKKLQQKEETNSDDANADGSTDKKATPSSSSSSSPASIVMIKGLLVNYTRTIRDPKTGQVLRANPPDVARILVDGGDNVFFADAVGHFALALRRPAKGTAARRHHSFHQLDIDWHKSVFPRVLIEVDEFGNYRAYQDGTGKIIAARGTLGRDSKSEPARDPYEIIEEGEQYDPSYYQNQMEVLELASVGEQEYFVPRQEFRILDLLKNPMIIMMVITGFMVYVMPKIVDQDELKAQMREMQNVQKQGAAALSGESSGASSKNKVKASK